MDNIPILKVEIPLLIEIGDSDGARESILALELDYVGENEV